MMMMVTTLLQWWWNNNWCNFSVNLLGERLFSWNISSPNAFIGRKITKGEMFSLMLLVQSVNAIRVYRKEFQGTFHSTQNCRNFHGWIKWNRPFQFCPTEIFRTSFEGGPLWPVWSFRSVGPKYPFPFCKLLFPVPLFCFLVTRTITKRAVAWVGSLQPESTVPLGTWNFRNFKLIFCCLNGKHPQAPQ